MAIELLAAAKILNKPITDLYDTAKDSVKNKFSKFKTEKNVNELYRKIASVQKVKTIWQVDKEVNLKSFYYPSRLKIDDNEQNINAIKKLPINQSCIIQGTVGQGKSIFMRYLCSQELRIGEKVPVFYELRKVQKGESLYKNILLALEVLSFDGVDEVFEHLASSGKMVLLLDGFDEIDTEIVPFIIKELEFFSEKYQNLQIIISSRPESGIERSTFFHVYKLCPLNEDDQVGLIRKLVDDSTKADDILSVLKSSPTKIINLLKTPLMVTLFIMIYRAEQKIPEELSDFYENVFQTLLYRHDKTKPGFVRKRNTKVNERQLQQVFEAFCFFTRKNQKSVLSYEQFYDFSSEAAKAAQIECDSSNFITDITKVACLVLEEGQKYYFIHKSVQEFYAANFVKNRPEVSAIQFYTNMLGGKWEHWVQELNFLKVIDVYRFSKFFLYKDMVSFLESFTFDVESNKLSSKSMNLILDAIHLISLGRDQSKPSFGMRSEHWNVHSHINGSYSRRIFFEPITMRIFRIIMESQPSGGLELPEFIGSYVEENGVEIKEMNNSKQLSILVFAKNFSIYDKVCNLIDKCFVDFKCELSKLESYIKNEEMTKLIMDV